MFLKIALALALALATTSGALAATKKKPKVRKQNLYDLSERIHRDTYTHDFRGPPRTTINNPNQGKDPYAEGERIHRNTYTHDFRGRKTKAQQSSTQ